MKQTSFKVKKIWRNYPKKNNPLYQIEVYSQEYLIHSKFNYDYQT